MGVRDGIQLLRRGLALDESRAIHVLYTKNVKKIFFYSKAMSDNVRFCVSPYNNLVRWHHIISMLQRIMMHIWKRL